jgi:hypothetical protein
MASKFQNVSTYRSLSKKRGKHAKKASNNKASKHYSKPYKGQGR